MIFLILILIFVIWVVCIKLSVVAKKNRTLHSFSNLDKLLQERYKAVQVLLNLVKTNLTSEAQLAEYSEKLMAEAVALGTKLQNIDRRIAYDRELVKNTEQIIAAIGENSSNNELIAAVEEYNRLSVPVKHAVEKYNADAHILRVAVDTFPSSFIARLSKIRYIDTI